MTETETLNAGAQFVSLRTHVVALLEADTRTPTGIKLGPAERAALEAHVRESSGQSDVGPVISFHGLAVVSTDTDGVELSFDEPAKEPD